MIKGSLRYAFSIAETGGNFIRLFDLGVHAAVKYELPDKIEIRVIRVDLVFVQQILQLISFHHHNGFGHADHSFSCRAGAAVAPARDVASNGSDDRAASLKHP